LNETGKPLRWGQRMIVRILAFALRRGADPVQLSHALCLCFRHWSLAEIDAVWAEVEDRAGQLVPFR
jgi:hypothetical protein